MDINKVILVGRLTKDIEIKGTRDGKVIVKFTLAVNRMKKQDGTQQTDFVNCVAWERRAEALDRYVGKGDQIGIVGTLQTSSYEAQDGRKRYYTEVLVDTVQFLQTKEKNSKQAEPAGNPFVESNVISDDLPF